MYLRKFETYARASMFARAWHVLCSHCTGRIFDRKFERTSHGTFQYFRQFYTELKNQVEYFQVAAFYLRNLAY